VREIVGRILASVIRVAWLKRVEGEEEGEEESKDGKGKEAKELDEEGQVPHKKKSYWAKLKSGFAKQSTLKLSTTQTSVKSPRQTKKSTMKTATRGGKPDQVLQIQNSIERELGLPVTSFGEDSRSLHDAEGMSTAHHNVV
ncbi:hypothetical protein ADUPG1_005361, partial [Aduncisulcus paluster]